MFIEIWMRGGPTPDAEVHPPLGVLRLFAWKHVRAVRACGMPENLTERNNMENAQILHLTETNFQSEVLDSPQPVLVDFWAPWCGPCRMLAPTLENLATTYAGKVRVGKVNVDDNQRLAATYRIEGIPTVMLFQDGQAVQSLVGVHPADDFQRLLDSHVAKD